LFAPDGTIAEFDQIITNPDGSFSHKILDWPSSSTKYPFGTYTVEAITNTDENQKIDIKFASSTELELIPIERKIITQVFAPEMAAADQSFRVFVQVTSDGLLVSGDAKKVLSSSHIHSPNGKVQSLAMSMEMLHQGLYFVEYTPRVEGTYIFHMVAFSQGTQSHGSAATLVLGQDIAGMSRQIITLNEVLTTASDELGVLQTDIHGFGSTLEDASTKLRDSVETIDTSVASMSSAVDNIEEASLQVNSLLFPIMGAIAVILALQISIIARRR
jgi:methyl-accepting chemotaxis protein